MNDNLNNNTGQVVTRMAPSPTGSFHVGSMRTLLFNYFFARHHKGKFILRSEDTDKERSRREYEDEIKEALAWLGIHIDDFYRQSENLKRHQSAIADLLEKDFAYEAEDSKEGEGKVIRFRNPGETVTFKDGVLGEVSFDTTDLGDFVIARNMMSPLYHLAVVIDDSDEGITHVIRAQEHIANTPRQILLIKALGLSQPEYSHIPFILGADGKKKLSKRDGDVAILDYQKKGYLPEAMINFLAFIGWNPGGEEEVYSIDEIISKFDLAKVQKGPAGFNIEKLRWLNREHLLKLSDSEFIEQARPFLGVLADKNLTKLLPIIRERTYVFGELKDEIEAGEYDYVFKAPGYSEPEKIIWKKSDKQKSLANLKYVSELISGISDWESADNLKEAVWPYAQEQGVGDVLWPLRYALSGKEKSPDPFALLYLLGKDESLLRINNAISALSQ